MALLDNIKGIPESITAYNFSYSLARTLLSLSSLFTVLFNDPNVLFNPTFSPNIFAQYTIVGKYSLFFMMYPEHLVGAKVVAIILLLITLSGYLPQITCFFQWWVSFSIFSSAYISEGGDQINMILSLLLIPVCVLDSRINHWQKAKPLQLHKPIVVFGAYSCFFFFLAIKLQVAFLYLNASIGKLPIREWRDGTALYYYLTDSCIGAPDYLATIIEKLVTNRFTVAIMTWGAILFEFVLFLSITFSNSRKYFLYMGLVFHFLIFILHGLFTFFLSMAAALLLYYSPFYKNKNNPLLCSTKN